MAGAIIMGGLRAGVLASHATIVAEPDEARRNALAAMGVIALPDVASALTSLAEVEIGTRRQGQGAVMLAVKPQVLQGVAPSLVQGLASPPPVSPRLIVSILAGMTRARLAAALGASHRIVRVMPNLPLSVGQGMTAIAEDPSLDPAELAWVERLFASAGKVERFPEELMDAFTALAGSGPAYLFYLAEALERAGISIGFSSPQARAIVAQTLRGAIEMLVTEPCPAFELRAAVTSKGGTTEAACRTLDEAGVMAAFERALTAARDRGRELSQG